MPIAEVGIMTIGRSGRMLKKKEVEELIGREKLKEIRKAHKNTCLVFWLTPTDHLIADIYEYRNTLMLGAL